MKITTIITFLLAALLLFGCIAQKAEEKPNATIKNKTANAENAAKNTTAAYESKNSAKETTIKNESATNKTNITNNATLPKTNVSQNLTSSGIPVAYFYSLMCQFCKNATIYIAELEGKYPISVQKYEIYYNLSNFNLLKQYAEEYRLKDEEFAVPIAFINTTYFAGPDIYGGLENKIQNLTKENKK